MRRPTYLACSWQGNTLLNHLVRSLSVCASLTLLLLRHPKEPPDARASGCPLSAARMSTRAQTTRDPNLSHLCSDRGLAASSHSDSGRASLLEVRRSCLIRVCERTASTCET